jgi:hypothetical protein
MSEWEGQVLSAEIVGEARTQECPHDLSARFDRL